MRQKRRTQVAQQGSNSLGNEANMNVERKLGGGAHNEHMYYDVLGNSEAAREWTFIYSPRKLKVYSMSNGILLI